MAYKKSKHNTDISVLMTFGQIAHTCPNNVFMMSLLLFILPAYYIGHFGTRMALGRWLPPDRDLSVA